ncbi:dienelactone hydrolase family protein [Hydrogenophaga sp.]|uniref:dienelactone hydrolase family protein n=1 Tax=Hydrogenophaga sp. TaxID=1904254 RepID=UPI002715A5FF|nr:dienelactone hydrolase family protein [Hydrogenophaga sp.]MDO9436992.1 dienelactone hydrolase family protein [Hydrogenophaga sp.]
MKELQSVIQTPDGEMRAFVAHPATGGPFPAVVIFQNVGGLSDSLRACARRVAAAGYFCVVPDLYYRLGRIEIDPDDKADRIMAVRRAVVAGIFDAEVLKDTRSVLDFLETRPEVKPGPKGSIGYCMGGRFCIQAAELFPKHFKATVSLFGTRLVSQEPDSPRHKLDRIEGELYVGFPEHDHAMTQEMMDEFADLVRRNCRATHVVEFHPGTEHGFALPGRAVYHEGATERCWEHTFAMFSRQLGAEPVAALSPNHAL